jgi:hypothetical protein
MSAHVLEFFRDQVAAGSRLSMPDSCPRVLYVRSGSLTARSNAAVAQIADRLLAASHTVMVTEVEFSKICEAAGGYGERVTEPDAVPAAIQRCLKEVRGGRSALMHVRIPVL